MEQDFAQACWHGPLYMAAKQEVTIEEAEGAVTVSTWARAPSAGVALYYLSTFPAVSASPHLLNLTFFLGTLPFVFNLYQVPGGCIRARAEAPSSSPSSEDSKPNKFTLFPNDYMGKQTR